MMMHERMRQDAGSAILWDAATLPQVDAAWFVPGYWRERGALRVQAGGRGGVAVIESPVGECVLRHYRRGGFFRTAMGDRYLWTGADRSRPFREFRLLTEIIRLGLPGPVAIAARFHRRGMFYRADLITRRIEGARTLAECLAGGQLDHQLADAVGGVIGRFHRAGIWHADLNANNVLVSADGPHLIDFDRGQKRKPAPDWQRSNLQRLRRSLLKLGAADRSEAVFEREIWQPLLHGHWRTLTS
ncbi:MAG TPA: 3-deoxy-D-manno-octulosonic acid kinase [Rhodanobacter sp.]|jgi:3-deoxy-D-manno-octulosonic acid kinase|nr:3-deoxy-D-manno-octulosonic acid kinase [Rhodanobacter sp.]